MAHEKGAEIAIGLASIVVHITDPERSLRLYRDGLGFSVAFDSGWNSPEQMLALTGTAPGSRMRVIAMKNDGGAGLSLVSFDRPTTSQADFESAGQVHVGIAVHDLDVAVASAVEHGAEVFGIPGTVGGPGPRARLAFLRDPDGVVLELVERHGDGDR